MLSRLDNIIFPDRCDVLEIVPSQRFVYPIYKNGSTSLIKSNFKTVEQSQLQHLKTIDIFVRDPYERFLSGVQTFLSKNLQYDRNTALLFISEYLFLNRHFCPQFYWLMNLKRFTDAKIKVNHISTLKEVTSFEEHKQEKDPAIDAVFRSNAKLHFYLTIDKVLTELLVGHTVRFTDIVKLIEIRHPDVYLELIQRSKDLCNVLD